MITSVFVETLVNLQNSRGLFRKDEVIVELQPPEPKDKEHCLPSTNNTYSKEELSYKKVKLSL
jgi:hypothetical protein